MADMMKMGTTPENAPVDRSAEDLEGRVITQASAYWIKVPLSRPYTLSFGSLTTFDMIVVRVVDDHDQVGLGEVCPVPPYSIESAEEVWARTAATLPRLIAQGPRHPVMELADSVDHASGFSYVAALTACEALLHPAGVDHPVEVPLVGTVQSSPGSDPASSAYALTQQGYRTLKVKVGFDPFEDLARVASIADAVPDEVMLRLDANEAWNLTDAQRFLGLLDPAHIELLEQPVPRHRWDWIDALQAQQFAVPLMLDEAIDGEASVRRAADAGIGIVKFKLMKAGSRSRLQNLRALAEQLGMSVVIGNGIAGAIDNWYESLVAEGCGRAGEMNGHLKLADRLLTQQPKVERGVLRFPAGFSPHVAESVLMAKSIRAIRLP